MSIPVSIDLSINLRIARTHTDTEREREREKHTQHLPGEMTLRRLSNQVSARSRKVHTLEASPRCFAPSLSTTCMYIQNVCVRAHGCVRACCPPAPSSTPVGVLRRQHLHVCVYHTPRVGASRQTIPSRCDAMRCTQRPLPSALRRSIPHFSLVRGCAMQHGCWIRSFPLSKIGTRLLGFFPPCHSVLHTLASVVDSAKPGDLGSSY